MAGFWDILSLSSTPIIGIKSKTMKRKGKKMNRLQRMMTEHAVKVVLRFLHYLSKEQLTELKGGLIAFNVHTGHWTCDIEDDDSHYVIEWFLSLGEHWSITTEQKKTACFVKKFLADNWDARKNDWKKSEEMENGKCL